MIRFLVKEATRPAGGAFYYIAVFPFRSSFLLVPSNQLLMVLSTALVTE